MRIRAPRGSRAWSMACCARSHGARSVPCPAALARQPGRARLVRRAAGSRLWRGGDRSDTGSPSPRGADRFHRSLRCSALGRQAGRDCPAHGFGSRGAPVRTGAGPSRLRGRCLVGAGYRGQPARTPVRGCKRHADRRSLRCPGGQDGRNWRSPGPRSPRSEKIRVPRAAGSRKT